MENTQDDTASRGIGVTATLNAPIARVWEAWTNPEQIAQWWGPKGFTNTIHTMELEAGGEWKLTMQGPDGKTFPNKSRFVEIVPQQKIVFQHYHPHYLATILFESRGNETFLDWTMVFETPELFETVVKVFKADEGLKENVGKLEDYLNHK